MTFTKEELINYIDLHFMGKQIVAATPIKSSDVDLIDTALPPPVNMLAVEDKINDDESVESDNDDTDTDTYLYLDDSPLSNEFHFGFDNNKLYKIALCLYKINNELDMPFLEYFFQKTSDNKYSFPQFDLNMEPFNDNTLIQPNPSMMDIEETTTEADDESNEVDDEMLSQCSQYFTKLFSSTDSVFSKLKYKGFIEKQDENISTIFAVFDSNDINLYTLGDSPENVEGVWGIIDEVLNKRKIINTPIDDSVYDLFIENKIMIYMKYYDGINLPIPISTYPCTYIDNHYVNTYYTKNTLAKLTMSLISPSITHDYFDKVYMFSNEPLSEDNLVNIKRNALFIDKTLYFANKNNPISEILAEYTSATNKMADTDKDGQTPTISSPEFITAGSSHTMLRSNISGSLHNGAEDFSQTPLYNKYSCFSFYDGEHKMYCTKFFDLFTEL